VTPVRLSPSSSAVHRLRWSRISCSPCVAQTRPLANPPGDGRRSSRSRGGPDGSRSRASARRSRACWRRSSGRRRRRDQKRWPLHDLEEPRRFGLVRNAKVEQPCMRSERIRDDEMTITLRCVVYAAVLLVISAYSLTAKGDGGPPYGSGPSVFVPFVNATLVGDPSQYISPQISVGFAPTTYFNVTMDTGSVGIIVGSSYFSPPGPSDPSFVGPGSETLTSSGIMYEGDWYTTTVYLFNDATWVASSTVPVMAVTTVTCIPGARDCNPAPVADTSYFGIGFAGGAGLPQGTPDKNAFLNITDVRGGSGLLPSPGYILSTQGVQIGLTSSNTQGFAMIKLEPLLAPSLTQWQTPPASPNVLTDWQHARGTITVNGRSGSGIILFDTGVNTSFLTPPTGVTPKTGMGPINPIKAECNGSNPPSCAVTGTTVRVSFPNQTAPVASLNYTVGANNGPQSGNPVSPIAVSVEQNSAPFLNTSVRFLQAFEYIYDAANGFIGLKTTGITPAQYAASTPSGLAVQGVFQCFFSWAQTSFGSPPSVSQTTKYSWPYTYRNGPNTQTYIGISSGSSASPTTEANNVYILGADGQATSQGALSGWLSAAGCQ